MHIKTLQHDEFTENLATIQRLLKVLYINNFKISEELCNNIITTKVIELEGYVKSGKGILIGAFINELLVGFIWIYKHDFFGETRLHINQIVVEEDFRGRGIAKELLTEAERLAFELDIHILDLFVSEENYVALKMYEDLGYITERKYLKKKL